MGQHKIMVTRIIRNWIIGTIDGIKFEAKVYDIPSEFGIDDGKVCKLDVYRDRDNGEIIAYERGWENYPAAKHEDLLNFILEYCKKLPSADNWQLANGDIISKEGTQ